MTDVVTNTNPAVGVSALAWLMIAVPLMVSGILLVAGRASDRWGHWLAVAASWFSFIIGVCCVAAVAGDGPLTVPLFDWAITDQVKFSMGLHLDQLSLTFVMLVTFVGSLIHVYSVEYMAHDADRRRFFAYLNMFIAAMLTLVLADSYLLMFFGWEGVGLVSYLLIGFWNSKLENAQAAKKAFLMNRVGDMGLLLALASMFTLVGSFKFSDVIPVLNDPKNTAWATAIGLFLLLAACGKSAQFPLQAWLGDAMAGPTPVSALIHAATMVTAGVYLMVRSGSFIATSPTAQLTVAIVGAVTLLFGAIVGCAKDDMKKVLAASTMSQIGYMMLGAGLGPIGWTLAIFHLLIHGFFKAQLFLGAGSVMHAMNDQVNIRRFGALRTVMKVSWITFGIAWLAILGIPPFSGFFSKEPIIAAAFNPETFGTTAAWVFGLIAMIGAGITSFYMSRLFFMIFFGSRRWTTEDEGGAVHPHEPGWLMNGPILVLSVFSIALGGVLSLTNLFEDWLSPALGSEPSEASVLSHTAITAITLVLALLGIALAAKLYMNDRVPKTAPRANALVVAARNDLYQDEVIEGAAVLPTMLAAKGVGMADRGFIDGIVRGVAWLSMWLGRVLRYTENGFIRTYGAYIGGGALIALIAVLATRI
ncbi:MAG: NADH-quinone oxidoreductase subunit L [Varibaculum sp.]|nr:NADH-quinone oxidoreductase subunit L [Varibaculum sp.]